MSSALKANRVLSPTFNGTFSKQFEMIDGAADDSLQTMFFNKDESTEHQQLLPALKENRDNKNSSLMEEPQKRKNSKLSNLLDAKARRQLDSRLRNTKSSTK